MAQVHVHPEDAGPADDSISRESFSSCPADDSISRESFSSSTTAAWRPALVLVLAGSFISLSL